MSQPKKLPLRQHSILTLLIVGSLTVLFLLIVIGIPDTSETSANVTNATLDNTSTLISSHSTTTEKSGLKESFTDKRDNQSEKPTSGEHESATQESSKRPTVLPRVASKQTVSQQQPLAKKRSQQPELSSDEKTWIKYVPILHKSYEEQKEAVIKTANRIIHQIRSSVTDEGINAFIEEALSLESATMMTSDSQGHREWIKKLFLRYVFPMDPLKHNLLQISKQLSQSLSTLNSNLLVELEIDIEYDPNLIQHSMIDLTNLESAIDQAIDPLLEDIYAATAKSATSFGASAGAAYVGHSVARNSLKDEQGNVSFMNEIIAGLISFGTEYVVSEIADEILQPREELRLALVASTNRLLKTCDRDGAIRNHIIDACLLPAQSHIKANVAVLVRSLLIDSEWAIRIYNSYQPSSK